MVFEPQRAVQIGSNRPRFSSVLNHWLNGNRCISTENKKIAVTVTLYQNNRDSVARFGYMNTMQLYHKEYGHRPDQS